MAVKNESEAIGEKYLLLLLEGMRKSVDDGFKSVNHRFDQMDERFKTTATIERLESEVKRLDREDFLNRDSVETLRTEVKETIMSSTRASRWRWGVLISLLSIVASSVVGIFVK